VSTSSLRQDAISILLVEDSEDDAELILCALREAGLAVVHERCGSERELLAALARRAWDIVLTDYNLPALSAREVIPLVRAGAGDIPVIVVSGHIGEEEAVQLMKAGAGDFVAKANLLRLAPAVERELREAQVRQRERETVRALREQERFLRDVTSALGEGILVMDDQLRLVFMNPEAERLLGWTEAELLGRRVHEAIHHIRPDGSPYPESECPVRQLARNGERCHAEDETYVCKDGSLLSVSFVATRIVGRGGEVSYVVAFQDRTARKLAEDELRASRRQLRELSAFLQRVREEERAHLARELHDELGQVLSGLRMDLEWLQRHSSGSDNKVAAKMETMAGLLDSTLKTVRRMSADLRPAVLDDLGLEAAVEWLVEGFGARTGVDCRLRLDLERLTADEPLTTTVFRLVQESLTNVGRHARANQVDIDLYADDSTLTLTIADDGVGFTLEAGRPRSFGLLGMRERVLALGGRFAVHSRPGAGTAICVSIPLEPTQQLLPSVS